MWHPELLALTTIVVALGLMVGALYQRSVVTNESSLNVLMGIFTTLTWVFALAVSARVLSSTFATDAVFSVSVYLTWLALGIGVTLWVRRVLPDWQPLSWVEL